MALAETARLIAALELQDKFSGPAGRVDRSIGGLERSVGRLDRVGSTAARGIGTLTGNVLKLGSLATGALIGGLGIAVNAASDLNEEIDKSTVVFGSAAPEVQAFADGAAALGLSKAEALGAAGAFGNMFNTVGLAQGESADMSETMVQLAADMASFNNEDPSEMLDKLRSGLTGEAEPLRRFGVLLSEASVKEFAYRKGIAKTGSALTEAQKVQARYGLILEQTEIQQGNFADTSEGLANQQRILRANLSNTAATIGTALLPAVGKIAQSINDLFIDKQPQIAAFGDRLGEALDKIISGPNLDRAIDGIGGFIDKLAEGDISGTLSQFSGLVTGVGSLPWESIGNAATLLGTGSKAMLDAFLGLPDWVQTAVLTGWGLNKLTGGALSTIFGTLASGIIKGILNMNAAVVNINAGTVTGGPGVPGGKPPGGIPPIVAGPAALLGTAAAAGTALAIGTIIGTEVHKALAPVEHRFNELASTRGASRVQVEGELLRLSSETGISVDQLRERAIPILESGDDSWNQIVYKLERGLAQNKALAGATAVVGSEARRIHDEVNDSGQQERTHLREIASRQSSSTQAIQNAKSSAEARAAIMQTRLSAIEGVERGILAKKSTVNVTTRVTIPIQVSTSNLADRIYDQTVTASGLPAGDVFR